MTDAIFLAVPIPSVLAGHYAIERELGSGGMATVYLAHDTKHQRQVAVKVMRPELAVSLGAERFLREIAIAASLTHPHIVPLHDSGVADGLIYYVMPFIEGESLRQRLAREQQLPVEEALRLTREIADALAHAHSRGLIHRDIKPENVLLSGGHALVADFGIARAISVAGDRGITETGMVVGTPHYMSPEQASADPRLDARSDVYSLACVLYEMLAGEPPFTGPTAHAVLARRLVDPMPSLRAARDTVPEHVEAALRRALAPAPADRFPTATAFADALERSGTDGAPPRSVAVLPFLNLSADPENEYFADGITEDVIAQLSKIGTLSVISRTSVMQFKQRQHNMREIADQLRVATLLEGSVRRAGDRVRIVAQLIDARTDRHLWADTYDRHLTDIFAIQSDVALHIAAALQAELTADERVRIAREPTRDVQAYQLYLQGRHCLVRWTPDGMRQGIGYYEQAVARDPGLAPAWAGIAFAWVELFEVGAETLERAYQPAKSAAERSLAVDRDLADGHCVLAYARMAFEFDWQGAESGFKRALELSPNHADALALYGRMCASQERYEEAIFMTRRAHELDPLAHRVDVATAFLRAGRNDEALERVNQAIEFDPGHARAHATRGWVLVRMGKPDEGIAELEQAVALAPGETQWLAQLGEACGEAGRVEQAREILRRLEEQSRSGYVAPYHFAYVHTGLGEADRALDYLEGAYEQRAGAVYGIKGSFLFATLRGHPRFQALLRKMNLA